MRKKQQTAWSTVLQLDAHHAELSFYTTASTLPAPSSSLALQHVDIHLARQGLGIETVNHLHTGSGIPGQHQSVDTIAIQQSIHDAAVPERVETAMFAIDIRPEPRNSQNDFELML